MSDMPYVVWVSFLSEKEKDAVREFRGIVCDMLADGLDPSEEERVDMLGDFLADRFSYLGKKRARRIAQRVSHHMQEAALVFRAEPEGHA